MTAVTVRVEDEPAVIDEGLAEICTVGAGLVVTVSVTDAVALPPLPVAVAVYVVVVDGLTV